MTARLQAPRAAARPVTTTAPAGRAGLACPRLPAAAEVATIGAGYAGYALVRLAIHADRHAAFVIHIGGQAAVVVPVADFVRLRALELHASAEELEDAAAPARSPAAKRRPRSARGCGTVGPVQRHLGIAREHIASRLPDADLGQLTQALGTIAGTSPSGAGQRRRATP
jgi:hypothetical protein